MERIYWEHCHEEKEKKSQIRGDKLPSQGKQRPETSAEKGLKPDGNTLLKRSTSIQQIPLGEEKLVQVLCFWFQGLLRGRRPSKGPRTKTEDLYYCTVPWT